MTHETDPVLLAMQRLQAEHPDRTVTFADAWIHVSGAAPPDQGWKLHVSATPVSAPAVLARTLPVLLEAGVEFKVAGSSRQLAVLNMGLLNMRSQVGKFITIYPPDDATAVRLAAALHEATRGLEGPAVPSDRPLCPGSLVHYRYGAFRGQFLITPVSVIMPALREPGGRLVLDQRRAWYTAPAWAPDPFAAAGLSGSGEQVAAPGPIGTRYKVQKALQQAGKGGVYLAEDLGADPVRTVVLKEARRHVATDRHGRDARDRLRHEYELLRALHPCDLVAQAYDLFEQEGNLYLVMEQVVGQSLRSLLTPAGLRGELLPMARVLSLGRQIAGLLGYFHERGLVLRDFTPNNLMLQPDGRLRLIDLELAYTVGSDEPAYDGFTRGYARPGATDGPPTPADDLYALGGILFYLATCADPVVPVDGRPQPERLLRLLDELRPDLPPPVRAMIGRLLAEAPDITLADVEAALAAPPTVVAVEAPVYGDPAQYLDVARRVGDWLLRTERPDDPAHQWQPSEAGESGVPVCIQYGSAGVGLFLIDLYAATGDGRYLAAAERAAAWSLRWVAQPHGLHTPGLIFGQGGLPWLLMKLSEVSGRPGYLQEATKQARRIDRLDCPHPDLTHGLAGLGLLHVALAGATAEPYHLHRTRAIADQLLNQAVPGAGGGLLWPMQIGPQPETFYGWAHGAAGIGCFLMEAARVTGEERYLGGAQAAARELLASHEAVMDGAGWSWAYSPRNPLVWPHLCNGASGVGEFLLRLYGLTGDPSLREAIPKVGAAAARGCRSTQAGLCHGIAGEGEFLIDIYQVTGDRRWLAEAAGLADLLDAKTMAVDGTLLWETDGQPAARADYMVGAAGVGHFHLRLALPDRFARAVTLRPVSRPLEGRERT